ncbi:MAG: iron-sulfur cluster biosynthesis family protein [Thiobacillaceae bacterium]
MIKITDAAAAQIKIAANNPDVTGMILRVAAKRMNDDSITFGMGFDQEREADELVIVNGTELLLAKPSLPFIQGVTLDYVEMEGEMRFIFIPPNSGQAT